MPSARARSGIVAGVMVALVVLGLTGVGVGAVLAAFGRTGTHGGVGGGLQGLGSALGTVFMTAGAVAAIAGIYVLTRGRIARGRARTTVPGLRPSTSKLPGAALFFIGLAFGMVALSGPSWLFVPSAIAGIAGVVLFARSGSPDEPA